MAFQQTSFIKIKPFSQKLFFCLFIFLCIVPSLAYGGDEPADLTDLNITDLLQVKVYSASKFEQKMSEAPSSVTIITASEIEKYGYRTLADILRSVRGLFVTYDRNYDYLGVRGFGRPGDYNTRLLLLVDGVRQNDTIFDQAAIGTDFILDVDLIDRVEIIRGPSSSLYGTNAFFAVINVISRKGTNLQGLEVSGDIGRFETHKGRISYGNKFQQGIEMTLSGSYYESKGDERLYYREFDSPETNNGIAKDSDGDRFHSFFGKVSFHDFTLEGAFVNRKKVIPTAAFETVFNDNRTFSIDERAFIDLKYEHSFANQLDVMARISYSKYDYDGDYVYNNAKGEHEQPDIVILKDRAEAEWWRAEAQATKKLFEKHKLIFGAEYQDNFRQDQDTRDKEAVYLDSKENSTNWGAYIQDEIPILSNLTLNAGVRHDHYSTFGGTTNPRLALIYTPRERTVFKILYGKAFRAPNAYELYYNDGGIAQKSNPDLKPEKIQTYELILEQQIGDNLRGTINGFYSKIDDLISLELDPSDALLVYRNIQTVETKGAELEVEGTWSNGVRGRVSYSYQDSKDKQTGKALTNSPKHLVKLNIIVPLLPKTIFLGIEEQYTSRRETLAGKNADDFFITNLTVFSQALLKRLKVSASVYNVFNKHYSDPGSAEHVQDLIRQDGRSFRMKATYTF